MSERELVAYITTHHICAELRICYAFSGQILIGVIQGKKNYKIYDFTTGYSTKAKRKTIPEVIAYLTSTLGEPIPSNTATLLEELNNVSIS